MNNVTGMPLMHAYAAQWRAMGSESHSPEQLQALWGMDHELDALGVLVEQFQLEGLALALPTQVGRWRRQWPRFVCLPDAPHPLEGYFSYGTSPARTLAHWREFHLPRLVTDTDLDVNDGIAGAVYFTQPCYQLPEGADVNQIGTVSSLERREVLIWEGCSYCGGDGRDPESVADDSCPSCGQYGADGRPETVSSEMFSVAKEKTA